MTTRTMCRGLFAVFAAMTAGCAAQPGGDDADETESHLASCADGDTVEGIDVSEFQGSIDWGAVQRSGRDFAIIRVSDGLGHPDTSFDANWAGAAAAGLVRGTYQFFRPTEDAIAQADLLLARMGSLGPGDLPPTLDVEVTDGASPSQIRAGVDAWSARVAAATGRTPIVYTAPGFWPSVGGGPESDTLWVANWQVACPTLPFSWTSWKVWQYADNGTVPGIRGLVDLDRFNGSRDALIAFARGGAAIPSAATGPVVAQNQDGRLEAFARGAGGSMVHTWQATPGGAWVDWDDLGGSFTADPAVASNADGRIEVLARGDDGALWHASQTTPNGGWSGWESLGGDVVGRAAATANEDGRIDVFVRGGDKALWHIGQTAPNGGWSDWESLSGSLTDDPTVVRNTDGRLEVFARGDDGALWHGWQTTPGGAWSGWASLGGDVQGIASVAVNGDGRLEVFARGADGALDHAWQVAVNGDWSDWAGLGGVLTSDPSAQVNTDGRFEVFARGLDNALYHTWQNAPGADWSAWDRLGGGITTDPAAARNLDGRLEVVARGSEGALWDIAQVTAGGGWSGWANLGGSIEP